MDNFSGTATFINTTITGNTASDSGGGVLNRSTSTFTNSTISGNTTSLGGGVDNGGTSTFTNTTISGNTATEGGGVYNNRTSTFTNSIIAKNGDGLVPDNIFESGGIVNDGGHNLIGDGAGQSIIVNGVNGNQVGTTAMPIDPLFVMDVPSTATNPSTGGDLRLQCGSPAIDAGSNAAATVAIVPTTDINGNPRIITKTIDIGAYEFQIEDATDPITLVTNTNDAGCGSLRFAVCNAMPGDTIRFDSRIDGDTIKLITEIVLDTNLVILGNPSASSGLAHNTIIDGMGTSRIFYIPAGDTVSISGIKMQGGNGGGVQPFGGSTTQGGAIYNQGSLTFTNSTISGNCLLYTSPSPRD